MDDTSGSSTAEGFTSASPAVRTFLIADIRGYTRFTHEHGDEEAGRLAARFAELARETVRRGGGELMELRGDEALCVFTSARQAVRTAVELQLVFRRAADDGPAFPLPIGIGLDAGEAVAIEDGYRGGALNTAARLCSLAKGGEVLATDTVVSLARRLEGIRFVERRPVRLKGFDKPVRPIEIVPEAGLPPLPEAATKPQRSAMPPGRRRRALTIGAAGALLLAGALLAAAMLALRDDTAADVVVPANSLAVVDPERGAVVAVVPVGRRPETVVAGAGAVWVANLEDQTVSRVDPRALRVATTVGLGFEPTDLAADDDHVWVAGGYDHVLWRLDRDGAPRLKLRFTEELRLSTGFEEGGAGVAVDGDSVWLSHGNELTEFDPESGAVRRTIAAGGTWHRELAAGADRVWVGFNDAERDDGELPKRGIDVVDRSGGTVLGRTSLVADTREILYASGRLWVAIPIADAVWELDPLTGVLQRTLHAGDEPEGLAFAEDALWITNEEDGTIRRVDPLTGEAQAVIEIGQRVEGVAAANGRLWVAAR